MLKKWIYIFTALCLLNTIFCYHVGDLAGLGGDEAALSESEPVAGDGTLLDLLVGEFQEDSPDNDNKTPLKIKCRHNHFYSRSVSLSIQAPLQTTYSALYVPEPIKARYGNYSIRKATLPSYYNFLFRLNLF